MSKGCCTVLRVLHAAGADMHALDSGGRTPLLYAAIEGHIPAVHTLRELGAPLSLHGSSMAVSGGAERDAARARGAFLVSGDGDGRVIAFDPPGSAEDRLALAGLPGAALACLQPGQAFSPQMTISEVQAIGIALMPASLRGVWVPEPNQWAARCGTEFGDEQHG